MANKNAVAEVKDGGVPAYLAGYKGPATNTMMENEDRIVPRMKLLQAISPELKSFNEAKEGVFWHSILNESLGSEVRFSVIMARKSYVLFAPRGDDRMILARSADGKTWDRPNESFEVKIKGYAKPIEWNTKGSVVESGLANFGSSIPGDPQSPPAATLVYEYLVYLPDYPDCSPALISLSRSGIKRGKDLNSKISLRAGSVPQFAQLYKAVVTSEQSAEGGYNGWSFKSDGVADEATFNTVLALAKSFETTSYRASDEDMSDEATAAPADSGGAY
jgi:hypothetical protein